MNRSSGIGTRRAIPFGLLLLSLGLFLGASVGVHFFAAQSIFDFVGKGIPDTGVAGSVAGETFRRFHLFAMVLLPLALILSLLDSSSNKLARRWIVPTFIGLALMLLLIDVLWIGPEIHRLREVLGSEYGNVSLAPKTDPQRARFGMLHGVSMVGALVQMILVLAAFLFAQLRSAK